MAVGQKKYPQRVALVNGNMDYNLQSDAWWFNFDPDPHWQGESTWTLERKRTGCHPHIGRECSKSPNGLRNSEGPGGWHDSLSVGQDNAGQEVRQGHAEGWLWETTLVIPDSDSHPYVVTSGD